MLWEGSLVFIVAIRAYLRQRLTFGGAVVAVAVGLSAAAHSTSLTITLLAYFYLANTATTLAADFKRSLDATYFPEGRRSAAQVLANGLPFALGTLLAVHVVGWRSKLIRVALGALGTSLGDTLASEVAPVYGPSHARLITNPSSKVKLGTNGGITGLGILLSWFGGIFCGGLYLALQLKTDLKMLWGLGLASMFGSLVDSLLGATIEGRYLDNDGVNFVANTVGGLLALIMP